MKLNTLERIMLLNVLPKEGSFMTLKIIRKFREKLSFTPEEHKLLKFKNTPQGTVEWDSKGDKPREFLINEVVEAIIVEALQKMDKGNKLTIDHMTLFEKFVVNVPGKPSPTETEQPELELNPAIVPPEGTEVNPDLNLNEVVEDLSEKKEEVA